jgi:hypothetical protein
MEFQRFNFVTSEPKHEIIAKASKVTSDYRHFELTHSLVLERRLECVGCHEALAPYNPDQHQIKGRKFYQGECKVSNSIRRARRNPPAYAGGLVS